MKSIRLIILLLLAGTAAQAQSIGPYYAQNDFLLASPGAMGFGLYGFDNPALLNYVRQPDIIFAWNTNPSSWAGMDKWGLFAAVPHIGFGVIRQDVLHSPFVEPTFRGSSRVTDYRLALGFGSRSFGLGLGYGWSGNNADRFPIFRKDVFTVGTLFRPNRFVSLGLTTFLVENNKHGIFDLAVRPLGTERLTLFGDHHVGEKNYNWHGASDNDWSAGAAAEFLPGVRLTARYFESKAMTVGVQLSLGRAGVTTMAHLDKDLRHSHTSYSVRLAAYDRNLFRSTTARGTRYVRMDWKGAVTYRRYVLFDRSLSLAKLLGQIDAAKSDPAVAGLAINLSGIDVDRELAWELREKLAEFRTTGKHVVVFIDRGGMTEYHLASVADRIVMDPTGTLVLNGYVMGRTFLKGTLEKLGVGFEEWRYHTYKSANEYLSRESMSEPDRAQRQALLDDLYELVRKDICTSRSFTTDRFDELVNDTLLFTPVIARNSGLVDHIGRWDTVEAVIKELEGQKTGFIKPRHLERYHLPYDHRWGEPPRVAVLYAIGVCDVEQGIAARRLANTIERVARDSRVKAVVLRVDSPGGDALASDLVAEALKKCKAKKPVIVSQGYVAASGGYWLSMHADTIVAAPHTITGSIGVIGGWLYNAGLKEKMGMTTDFVKVGRHGDLGFGFRTPWLGLGLPDRNMDSTERAMVGRLIQDFYAEFVDEVARARGKSSEEIDAIGQGRVWSGMDAQANGLVDVLGGLETAIRIARERANIPADAEVRLVHLPRPGLFDPRSFIPRMTGIPMSQDDPLTEYIQFRLRHNGLVMPILPLDDTEVRP